MGFLSSILGWWKRRRDGHEPRRYVSETAFRENLAKQTTMSPQTIAQLRKHGVTDDAILRLEFFFYTDAESKAQGLAESLQGLNYHLESKPWARAGRLFVVTGWTTSI